MGRPSCQGGTPEREDAYMSKIYVPNYVKKIAKVKEEMFKPKRVIFCCPGNSFSNIWVPCFVDTLNYFYEAGYSYRAKIDYHPVIFTARNKLLADGANIILEKKDIPFSGMLDYDFIMWIDSDMAWKPEQVMALLRHNKDIVTGITMLEDRSCNCSKLGDKQYDMMQYDVIEGKGLSEVESCGLAFCMVKKGVFEKIGFPWFRPVYAYNENMKEDTMLSEDLGFCVLAKEKGFKIYADPDIIVGHEKRKILGGDFEQPTW